MNQKTETKPTDAGLTRSIYDFVDESITEVDVNSTEFLDNRVDDIDSDPFLYSLENLTPDDIAVAVKKQTSLYDSIYNLIRYILLMICAGVFVYSAYQIGYTLWGYSVSQRLTEEFAGFMEFTDVSVFNGEYTFSGDIKLSPQVTQSVTSPDFETSAKNTTTTYNVTTEQLNVSVYNPNLEYKKIQMAALEAEFPDTYAWIKVPNTRMNYPVMQGTDNDFYLNHTQSGSYLQAGSIFADFRCKEDLLANFNTVLYGHNMGNGTMFNDIVKYIDEQFFIENPTIEIYTADGIFTYEIFAIYEARADDGYIETDFYTYESFVEFAEGLQARSYYLRDGGITFTKSDHILTLSTCTNRAVTGRYALHARLVNYEK